MSLENSLHLPRSVKVRSTCNACQQAKIRCSHEKPSCRRCQKHNIDCIYSMSRRLGRPAKKRDINESGEKEYRAQKCAKATRRKGNGQERQKNEVRESEEASIEEILQTALLREDSFSDTMDFASDSWLQDIVSGQSSDCHDISLLDSLDLSVSTGPKDPSISLPLPTVLEGPDQNVDGYFQDITLPADVPMDYLMTSPTTAPQPAYPEYTKRDVVFNNLPGSLLQPTDQSYPFKGEEFAPNILLESPTLDLHIQCECYEKAVRELTRVNNFTARATNSFIDGILTCQRGLQQLTCAVLQCGTCSRTRGNLLMIIIVSIDSLLSMLEATTSGVKAGAFDHMSDDEMGAAVDFHIGPARRYTGPRAAMTGFRSQIDSCPLLVGSFRIPSDEKYCFVKQLLHARLTALLATIRRIRFCTQQILAASCSRGRQIMMMETDRRLQLVMMKIKMLNG